MADTSTTTADHGGRRLVAAFTPAERRRASAFFCGAESTRAQRDQLRAALAAATDTKLAADLRAYFNRERTEGDGIAAVHVTAALRLLQA